MEKKVRSGRDLYWNKCTGPKYISRVNVEGRALTGSGRGRNILGGKGVRDPCH